MLTLSRRAGILLLAFILGTSHLAVIRAAQADEPSKSSTGGNPVVGNNAESSAKAETAPQVPGKTRNPKTPLSAGTQDLIRMAEAGVAKEVMKAYVENASVAFVPSAADMIQMKERGVPDEVTLALLKRSGEVRRQPRPPGLPIRSQSTGQMDPEGYDYFQYHYLYPRTLASAYGRLNYYPGPYSSWGGNWVPGFRPGFYR